MDSILTDIDYYYTKNYLTAKKILTNNCDKNFCKNCPLNKANNNKDLYCHQFELNYPEKAIQIVQHNSDENFKNLTINQSGLKIFWLVLGFISMTALLWALGILPNFTI